MMSIMGLSRARPGDRRFRRPYCAPMWAGLILGSKEDPTGGHVTEAPVLLGGSRDALGTSSLSKHACRKVVACVLH